jgi:molybdate transport system substrate-binding protein
MTTSVLRKHRTKVISGAGAASLLAAVTACGGSTGHSATKPATVPTEQKTLTVLAAASLTDVFTEAGKAYEAEHPGTKVRFSFAGSQQLAAQVKQGVPADVLVTADSSTMTGLGTDVTGSKVIAHNRLAIVTAPGDPDNVHALTDLADPKLKVVLAAPQVPAGKYASQALTAAHATVHPVSQEPDVRSVLSLVERGEADAGIVYTTDAKSAGAKVATIDIPDAQNVIATYPAAVLTESKQQDAAAGFVTWLTSPEGQKILQGAGFSAP